MDNRTRADAYQRHLRNKSRSFTHLLAQAGCADLNPEILPTPIDFGFRARAKFKLFPRPDGLKLLGTDPILGETEIKNMLWIIPAWLRDKIEHIQEILTGYSDKYPVDGFELRCTHGDFKFHICLSVKRSTYPSFSLPAEKLLAALPDLVGVAIPSLREEFGSCYLEHKFSELNILAHYAAFFQANLTLLTKLLDYSADELAGRSLTRIIDLYCGVGLFSLSLGNRIAEITGIDINKHAVTSAQKNAARMRYLQAGYICQTVESFIAQADLRADDLVIIDPDRSGCTEKLISGIAALAPNTICAISCEPKSFVRDLAVWLRSGYSVSSCRAFDMFPFTDFLETVFILQRT